MTALYEIISVGADEATRPTVELKYQDTELSDQAQQTDELMTVKPRYRQRDADESILMVRPVLDDSAALDEASDDFKFSAAVAEFGLLVRDSQFKGDAGALAASSWLCAHLPEVLVSPRPSSFRLPVHAMPRCVL